MLSSEFNVITRTGAGSFRHAQDSNKADSEGGKQLGCAKYESDF
jgi:hypothetical protein